MKMLNSLKPLAIVLTAGLMLSVFAAPAMAQGGGGGGGGRGGMGGGGGGMFGGGQFGGNVTGAPVSKADIEKMTKFLGLSDDQQKNANLMLEGYLAGYNKKADEFRKLSEEARAAARESGDWSAMTDLQPKMQEFRKYRADSEKQFFTDVKGILDKKQTEQFAAFERGHKREQSMNRGIMSGERADIAALVERLKLPADKTAALKPVLEAYDIEIEKPLEVRNAAQEKFMNDGGMRGLFTGEADEAARKKFEDMIKEGRAAATTVRDINRKYAKQVETILGGADGEKFAAEFRKSSFPEVYGRERYIDRAITAAAAMKDLQPGQLDGINALKEQYARDVKPFDSAAEKAIEDREANFSVANMMNFGRGQNDEAAQEARRQRRELEDGTLTKLKGILTPEQAEKLPERNQGGPGGGGGDGGQRRQRGGQGGGNNDGNNSGGGEQPRRQRGGNGGGGAGGAPARDTNPPAPKN